MKTSCNLLGSQFKHNYIHRVLARTHSNIPLLVTSISYARELWICLSWYHLDYFLHPSPKGYHPLTSFISHTYSCLNRFTKNNHLKTSVLVANSRVLSVSESVQRSVFYYRNVPTLPTIVSVGSVPSIAGTSYVNSVKSLALLPAMGRGCS